jgi:hypothetical protein
VSPLGLEIAVVSLALLSADPTGTYVPAKSIPGTYYFGDGLGVNCTLVLGREGRYRFRWTGCLGEYDKSQGSWRLEGDRVLLHPSRPAKEEYFPGMGHRFVVVPWGKRLHLVEENQMPRFAAEAKDAKDDDLLDQISTPDYVKVDAKFEKPPRSGRPQLPARYRHFYEKGPILARVVRVNPDGTVELQGKFAGRLVPGALMATQAVDRLDVKLLRVAGDSAVAQPRYYRNSRRKIAVGDAFTTGDGIHAPEGTGTRFYLSFSAVPRSPVSR